MRCDELTTDQLKWLNEQMGDCARKLEPIRQRMELRGIVSDDPVYTALCEALRGLFRACKETHVLLVQRRPAPPDPYKPSGYLRQRIAKMEEEKRAVERHELGK